MLRYFPLMPGGDLCQWRTVDNLKWNSRWVFLCARQFIISLVIYDKMLHGSTIETAVFLTGPFITNDSPEFKSIFEHIADSHIQLSTCLSCYNTHCGIPYCQIWEKRTKKKKKASVLLWCSLLICVSSSVLDFSFILTWMGWIFFISKFAMLDLSSLNVIIFIHKRCLQEEHILCMILSQHDLKIWISAWCSIFD